MVDLLTRAQMLDAKPVLTPMASDTTLQLLYGTSLTDPTEYRSIIVGLQYLTLTRPDIAFAVNRLSQFMHRPTSTHCLAVKRLLRYIRGTLDLGLFIRRHIVQSVHAFSDGDWAGNKDDYTSTNAYLVYFGFNFISWSSKKQRTVARSSTEVEYRSVVSTAAKIRWLSSLLTKLGVSLSSVPAIYCDNVGATHLYSNPVFHSIMKHIAIDFHFIRDQVQNGLLCVTPISSRDQLADTLTNPLP